MLNILNTSGGGWDLPEPNAKFTAKHSAEDLHAWEEMRASRVKVLS